MAAVLVTPARSARSDQATAAALLAPPPGERPVAVRAAFELRNISGLDEEAETFRFSGLLTLVWNDPRQAFDPAQAGVAEKVYQGDYQFNELAPSWYPQVVLANAADLFETHAVTLRVRPDGTSTLVQSINAAAKVDLDLLKCPFDRQRLEAVFELVGFNANEVVLHTEKIPWRADEPRTDIPQWTILDVNISKGALDGPGATKASALVLSVEAKRQSWFLLRLVAFPLMIIVALSWSVFWMDQSALGDRLSVSFVGILTAVAYMMVISDKLPQIGHVTLIHAFVSVSTLIMCGTVLVSLRVGARHRAGDHAGGYRLDRRCRKIFPLIYGAAVLLGVTAFLARA